MGLEQPDYHGQCGSGLAQSGRRICDTCLHKLGTSRRGLLHRCRCKRSELPDTGIEWLRLLYRNADKYGDSYADEYGDGNGDKYFDIYADKYIHEHTDQDKHFYAYEHFHEYADIYADKYAGNFADEHVNGYEHANEYADKHGDSDKHGDGDGDRGHNAGLRYSVDSEQPIADGRHGDGSCQYDRHDWAWSHFGGHYGQL